MDTPKRNKINPPVSKFEDSPVFNYINSLSPLRPTKSAPVAQTLNSLSYPSPPSIFTSPHVNCHKESRFPGRHNLMDTSKPKVSSEDVNKIYSREEAPTDSTHACHGSSELQENTDQRISIGDSSIEPSSEHTNFELPQALNSGSPGYDPIPTFCSDEASSLLESPGKPAPDAAHVQECTEKDSVEWEMSLQEDCDWENLITDTSDLLSFSSPTVTEALKGLLNNQLDPSIQPSNSMTLLPQSATNNGSKMHVNPVASGSEHEIEDHPSEPIAAIDPGQTQDNLAHVALMASNPIEKMDDELAYVTQRVTRRRCLDFEMASVQKNNSGESSNISSSAEKSDERNVGNEKPLLPRKQTGDSQRYALPGIGVHLNALATLKDYKSIKNEMMSSGCKSKLPRCPSSLHLSANQDHHLSLIPVSMERDLEPSENEVQLAEDCIRSSVYMADEDFHQNSLRKKRQKLEPAGEGEACKRCNCKKSKCLKLYCECFAAGVYCTEPCSCQDCFNKPIHEDTVLQTRKQIESRNPLAFAPKVVRSSDSVSEIGDDPNKTPASAARHKKGCNCKKSSCLKKYCECYQGGVGCSISCRCEGCKNAYGRKDGSGSAPAEIEAKPEEEIGKGGGEKASQKTEIQNIEDHPETPLLLSRPLLPLPFAPKGKPPRSFVTTISASGVFTCQNIGKLNALHSQSKFEKPFQTVVVPDDDSPVTCIKTSSPNGKRISSPICGPTPTRRGGKKLILQSIPSFPSLTPHPSPSPLE